MRHWKILLIGFLVLLVPVSLIWIIAGSDRLFLRTVPIEQRLISHSDDIRKKAQQELLGFADDAKRDTSERLIPLLGADNNPFARKWAAISLALIGPVAQEAIPALLQGVSAPEKDVAQACRVALSEIGAPDPHQLPTLLQTLHDPRVEVRCEAAASVAKMGPPAREAVPILLDEAKRGTQSAPCVMDALGNLAVLDPEVVPSILELLSQPDAAVRKNGAQALQVVGPRTPAIIDALLNILANDPDGTVRNAAANALTLRQTPDQGDLPSLLYVMRRAKSEAVRAAAIETLRRKSIPIEQAGSALTEALQDPSPIVRNAAVRWFRDSDVHSRFAVSALVSLLKDSDVQVRRLALQALQRTGTRKRAILTPVARAQRDPDNQVRCLAAEQLVEMGAYDRVAVSLLVEDLKVDADEWPCAADALGMAGHFNGDVVSSLIPLLQKSDRATRSRVAAVLMQLGAKAREAIPALVQAERDQVPGADNALRAIKEAIRQARPRR